MRRGLTLLPLGLLLLAAAEIAVFAVVAHALGAGWAVLLLAVSSLCGLILLRREGVRGWRAFRAAAQAGQPPGRQVSDSLVGLLGAVLLAAPGFVSAVLGLLLVVAPGRILARHAVTRFTERRVSPGVAGGLFGPRQVRVYQSDPVDDPAPAGTVRGDVVTGGVVAGGVGPGEVVEGEIVR